MESNCPVHVRACMGLGITGTTLSSNTHNMQNAIDYGNRLVMMNGGRIILDISGEEKKRLTIEDLLKKFESISGGKFTTDSVLLG